MSKSLEHEDTLQSEKIYYESILNEIEPYSSQISENIKKIENENKKKNIINISNIQDISLTKASKIIEEFVNFFVPNAELKNNDFIKTKMEIDKFVLSKVIFQSETCDYAIIKLLELIDDGVINARNFEVLSLLQKSSMEMLKFLVQLQHVIELTYRNYFDNFVLTNLQNKKELEMLKCQNNDKFVSGVGINNQPIRMKHTDLIKNIKEPIEVK